MLITREPFVIPTRWDWIGLLIIIGVFGFLAQVRAVKSLLTPTPISWKDTIDDGSATRNCGAKYDGRLHPGKHIPLLR